MAVRPVPVYTLGNPVETFDVLDKTLVKYKAAVKAAVVDGIINGLGDVLPFVVAYIAATPVADWQLIANTTRLLNSVGAVSNASACVDAALIVTVFKSCSSVKSLVLSLTSKIPSLTTLSPVCVECDTRLIALIFGK